MKEKKAKNPFVYGGRVSGDDFCDRENEIRELLDDIRARQHVILFSQRRFGKTSLVWKVLEEAAKQGIIKFLHDHYDRYRIQCLPCLSDLWVLLP